MSATEWMPTVGEKVRVRYTCIRRRGEEGVVLTLRDHLIGVEFGNVTLYFHPAELAPIETEQTDDGDGA